MGTKKAATGTKRKNKSKDEDFPKKKQKLGKKLQPSTHARLQIKSKSIHVSSQNLRSDDVIAQQAKSTLNDDEALVKESVTRRNLSLADITNQFGHYNDKIVANAIASLQELVTLHPHVLTQNLNTIIASTAPFVTHGEEKVRKPLKKFFQYIFPRLSESTMKPFIGLLIAHISNALTNLFSAIRNFGLKTLKMVLEHYENQCAQHAAKILPNLYNVFQMRSAGILYKGKNHKIAQELSATILNHYLSVLLHNNKLKVPNYRKNDETAKYFHHTHSKQNQNSTFALSTDFQKELIWVRGEVLPIQHSFTAVENQKMQVLHKLIHRKKADQSKVIFKEHPKENKQQQQQQKKKTTETKSNETSSEKGHVLLLSEDVSLYSLESEQSITLFLNKFSTPLTELFLEFLSPPAPMVLHNVLHSLYQLLYALEELSPSTIEPEIMQERFNFYKIIKKKAETMSMLAKSTQLGARSSWVGIMSFFDIEETGSHLVALFCKNQFKGDVRDLGILLGAFTRIHDYLPAEIQLQLWKGITNIFMNAEHLSDLQKLILTFFADVVLKQQRLQPSEVIFKHWASHLPLLLSKVEASNIQESSYLVSALSAFSKSIHQNFLTAQSLFPLFSIAFFASLPSAFQTSLIYLLFHSPSTAIPQALLKNMSQICANDQCDNGVASVLVEFVSLQEGISNVDKTTFLLSIACARSDLIDEVVVGFSNIPECLERISSFMNVTLKKELDFDLQATLLTVLYHSIVWAQRKQQSTDSVAVQALLTETLPNALLNFFKQSLRDQNGKHSALIINFYSLKTELLDHIVKQLTTMKEPVALDITLIILQHVSNTLLKERKQQWNTIYNNLRRYSDDSKSNYTLKDKLQQISSQLVLHNIH